MCYNCGCGCHGGSIERRHAAARRKSAADDADGEHRARRGQARHRLRVVERVARQREHRQQPPVWPPLWPHWCALERDRRCLGARRVLTQQRERVGESDLAIGLDKLPSRDVAGLKAALSAQDTRFAVLADQRTLCAINQVMANDSARITDEDEVAFFPPVTGG